MFKLNFESYIEAQKIAYDQGKIEEENEKNKKLCCGEFDNEKCKTPCNMRAKFWQGQAKMLVEKLDEKGVRYVIGTHYDYAKSKQINSEE